MTIHQPAKDEYEKFSHALILGYGGVLAMRDPADSGGLPTMTVGELITFQLYINQMNNAYQGLNDVQAVPS